MNELVNLIRKYENYIKKGNSILQSFYKIDYSPLIARKENKIPKNGYIQSENFDFNFHGMGCLFKFGDILVDFDYSYGDFVYKGFETFKLHLFIESYLPSEEIISEESLRVFLILLEKEGMLLKKDETSYGTYDYTLVG